MSEEDGDKIRVRDIQPEDMNFVFDSWFKSWRSNKFAGVIPNNMYFDVMRTVVEQLVGRGAKILVAECHSRLLGFICFEMTRDGHPVVHYIYVKDPYFKFGVGELLRAEAFPTESIDKRGFYTFKSFTVMRYFDDYRHAPEIARRRDL